MWTAVQESPSLFKLSLRRLESIKSGTERATVRYYCLIASLVRPRQSHNTTKWPKKTYLRFNEAVIQ